MTRAREQQISLSDTPYYHCINRCVRRAFLCGEDAVTGQNYDHRKQWIVDQLKLLSSVFAMDICAYAVMSNHYHVVLKVDAERVASWSDNEVIKRWQTLFKGNFLVQRYLLNQSSMSEAELRIVKETTALWRERLQDISWFMRCLNERIARQANREDQVKGRFWEGRFKSQALLDEQAVLSCMMYVDLNPIRAGLASTPEESEFTSIYERIKAASQPAKRGRPTKAHKQTASNGDSSPQLCPFADQVPKLDRDKAIAFTYADYLELLDWTGRAIRSDKRGSIPEHLLPILTRLGMAGRGKDPTEQWLKYIRTYRRRFASYAGSVKSLKRVSTQLGQRWVKGTGRYVA